MEQPIIWNICAALSVSEREKGKERQRHRELFNMQAKSWLISPVFLEGRGWPSQDQLVNAKEMDLRECLTALRG